MSDTRFSIAGVSRQKMGSVVLPGINLVCPKCGEPVADKGQCLAGLISVVDDDSCTGFIVKLQIDCRSCQADDVAPAIILD